MSAHPRSSYVPGQGKSKARIMLIGEFPSVEDLRCGEPFAGASGAELHKCLHESGLLASDCYFTYACKYRPYRGDGKHLFPAKKELTGQEKIIHGTHCHKDLSDSYNTLLQEIETIQPEVIVALGDTALWALTGIRSVSKWRSSILPHGQATLIPTYSPSSVLKMWDWRVLLVHDLRRAAKALTAKPQVPEYNFIVAPTYTQACEHLHLMKQNLERGQLTLSVDIETRAGHIACVGLAWSPLDAICIPFMCEKNPKGYWTFDQELFLIQELSYILTHKNASIIGQNFLYDMQYFAKWWGIYTPPSDDTMLMQGTTYPGMPKGLDFLSSLYCEYHEYWKDDGKSWDSKVGERQLWIYNCKDCVITWEVRNQLLGHIETCGLQEQYQFILSLIRPVFRMMLRGVKIEIQNRGKMLSEYMGYQNKIAKELETFLGPLQLAKSKNASPWYTSASQQKTLFYDQFKLPPVYNRKTRRPTCDDKALQTLKKKEPLLIPVLDRILQYRSNGVVISTFIQAPLDSDGRIRCSYNPVGTETFRFNSTANAFGSGTNLQNVPPKVRELFVPDPGYTFADCDLDRADLQVVVWEADDTDLKQVLREGLDVHTINASDIFGVPVDRVNSKQRAFAKAWVHGTNYGGTARTMARAAGCTVHESERAQARWFALHPGIKEWHRRVEDSLMTTRSVTNAFGFRRLYFGRIEGLLPEALAWIPQSTVAIVTNKGLANVDKNLPDVQVLLQVHDSDLFQYPTHLSAILKPKIQEQLLIEIPYDDPLTIPVGIKTSTISWGHCKEVNW